MVAVIDYGVGNLYSVSKAFAALGAEVTVTSDAQTLNAADKIVLPGVGAFGDCLANFRSTGLADTFMALVRAGKPILGICVGMQILFETGEESPEAVGLGIFRGTVRKINAVGEKIPHMGWNKLILEEHEGSLWTGLDKEPYVYFVHSYHAVPEDESIITARTQYGELVTAAVHKDNIWATQFHPEKSGDVGLKILANFLAV